MLPSRAPEYELAIGTCGTYKGISYKRHKLLQSPPMDPVRNPYSPGAGSPPPALVGRDEELEAFDIAVQRFGLGKPAKSLMLTGLRGVGKTVLLRQFGQMAKGHGWVHQHIEATEDLKFPEAMAMLVRKALLRLSAGQRLADRGRHAFGVLKSFQVRWQLPEGVDLVVGIDPVPGHADSGALEDDLAGLFIEVGELARDRAVGGAVHRRRNPVPR